MSEDAIILFISNNKNKNN